MFIYGYDVTMTNDDVIKLFPILPTANAEQKKMMKKKHMLAPCRMQQARGTEQMQNAELMQHATMRMCMCFISCA